MSYKETEVSHELASRYLLESGAKFKLVMPSSGGLLSSNCVSVVAESDMFLVKLLESWYKN